MGKTRLMRKGLNQSGQLTLEFMLACVLIVTVSTLLGILTFTLSLTEVLQYVTFASARSYLAADLTLDEQVKAGQAKGDLLVKNLPFLAGAQQSGWISIPQNSSKVMSLDAGRTYADNIGADTLHHNQFEGFQIQFVVPILNVKLPFLNSAIQPPNGAQDFKATLSSFLTREPAFDECQRYLNAATATILGKYSNCTACATAPTLIMDNGC